MPKRGGATSAADGSLHRLVSEALQSQRRANAGTRVRLVPAAQQRRRPAALSVAPPMVSALEQFLDNIRAFHQLFDVAAVCDRELLLRREMRRTMSELASAFARAAEAEPIVSLAKLYRDAAAKAAELAERPPPAFTAH